MLRTKLEQLSIEEVSNTITHGFGLILSIAGFIFLVVLACINGDFWHILSSVVYGASLVTLYAASTLYHSATSPELKLKLQILDHCCIYLLIAGSYTPFALIALRGPFGYGLFIFAWTFALVGIAMKVLFFKRFPILSVASYIVMGWVGAFAVQPLFAALGFAPMALVLAGGLAYSLGIIFFAWNKLPHNHAIWHVFVLVGSICHYLAVAIYVLPYAVNL